ncbi:MAG: hypothetical protein KBT29_12590 [Prevotellaceae bacterium]|nr:hypothetical protein [Candidatus Minthosoma caballi]
MTTSLSRVVESALPALSGSSVTYNAQNNIFLTNGYTSAAGNTYYQGIRLSDRIIVSYNIGEGYAHTFLNGVNVYGFNGREKRLIGSRSFNCYFFSESNAKREAIGIVTDYMKGQIKLMGASVESSQLEQFSEKLVEETYNQMRRIA